MSWLAVAGRVLLGSAIALAVGWYYGYPLQALILLLFTLIGFWLYQIHKVQTWLQDPSRLPPDAYGIWGDLLARIYQHQRKHRKVQNKLEEHVKYLQDSFASMRDGVVMVDKQGAIKWFNHAVEPLLGLQYPVDTGQTLTNLVRSPQFNQYFLGNDYSQSLEYVTSADEPRHLRVEITRFGKGERLLFIRDISEAVRLEQIRRDFVANVSHELRTPLTVIRGYLSTIIDQGPALPEVYNRPLQQMGEQTRRMENLVKDLLWLSRIENKQRGKQKDSVDMCGLLRELVEEFSSAFPQRKIELQLDSDRQIRGDYRELYSAMSNLLNNALKYSEAPSPVAIRWYEQDQRCIAAVRDAGIGIDATHIPRLTERFYRVDDSRAAISGGTGLGLAIVKHVMAIHGGELRISSQLARGSTFSLVFPEGEQNGS